MIDARKYSFAADKENAFVNAGADRDSGGADSQSVDQCPGGLALFFAVRLERGFEYLDRPIRQRGDAITVAGQQSRDAFFGDSLGEFFFVVADVVFEEVRDVEDIAEEPDAIAQRGDELSDEVARLVGQVLNLPL